jgi:ribonuclease G
MSKEMIVSVNGREKKIAILENGKVIEFYIERGEENAGIAGNIYKGRVQRVLPGMQSAFVSIGLERDAFLYVSDFFDEEEEIERVVMEKSKKSPEEAKREANDKIERARLEREKRMESAQEKSEPLSEAANGEAAEPTAAPSKKTSRSRGKKGRVKDEPVEDIAETDAYNDDSEFTLHAAEVPEFEISDDGFERIVDADDGDTGDMFKDAYVQEKIIDTVRAIEFDLETTAVAEVGSVMDSAISEPNGFERIADDDDAEAEEKPKKAAKGKAKTTKAASKRTTKAKTDKAEKPAKEKKTKTTKTTKSRSKAAAAKEAKASEETEPTVLEDAEASVKESGEIAEMAVRRGGRGRRRGGKGRSTKASDGDQNGDGDNDSDAENLEAAETVVETAADDTEEVMEKVVEEPAVEKRDRPAKKDRGTSKDRSSSKDRNGKDQRGRDSRDGLGRRTQPGISDLLHEGQEILVQIAKEPIAKKGARITSHIALPGRFLVYMPTIEHLGVSRKIESSSERGRLRTLIQRIKADEDVPSGGFIVRTAGIGISDDDLRQDARYLVRTWLDIKKTTEKSKSPALVHQDLDIVQRLLRDQLSDDFTAIRVDSEDEYLRTVEFINRIQPRLVNRVKLYTRDEPILETYNVQEEIDKALKPRVWLRSGGYLVINQTEALVAIDVNTGKFVGKGNARLEDTITRTNMEAVDEIARQIRLRDLGGIIVLDLIDMEDRRNRHKVSQALQEALASDKSPTKVLSFNDFGLIIMTRKRVKQSLERTMCAPCEYCEGSGWVKSPQSVCYELLAEARRLSRHLDDVRQTTLRVHPDVAKALRTTEREVFAELEAYLGNVDMTADKAIHQEQFDFAFI